MSPRNQKLSARVDGRLVAYATLAGVALAAPAAAEATIVYSGVINLSIPNNFDGVYINLVTGATGTSGGSVSGWNWNPYNGGTNLQFFWDSAPVANVNGGLSLDATTYAALAANAPITSGGNYLNTTAAAATANWRTAGGVNAYLGVRFINSATNQTNFGWIHLNTTGTTGFPATIVDYAYENAGGSILAGQVPEPSTFAMLGVMAAGAIGVRAWRKRKAA
jgi:hypothetical protein